ncbi:NAD(P)H-binding protein [Stenotrophomonas sp. MYb238]|uniref:NmrA family NAD(P)-binding protein n=1 Tax=Stenotrophomonas sp. MYb238 TaxID=2040281 RepID=UPI00129203D5|nr:NmrA family NAD(P)-binding protein [Stenotrophomonas sp. MYb238]MQP74448.1 NAD(P)H-binding protein [Stenotrophomonas sp. MYb238]
MTILVTGSTGHTGRQTVRLLAARGADVRALIRSPVRAGFPEGVVAVQGELADIDGMRAALAGVSTLFLLAPNTGDELHLTLTALNLAREAGVRGIVYLSVYQCDLHPEVPHFACKLIAERMIRKLDLPATILRPAFFMQNDLRQKPMLDHGLYGHPVGHRGMACVDTRDIAELAASELLRREANPEPLPLACHDVVGPHNLTAESITAAWSAALGRTIAYGGDDLDAFEARMARHVPAGFAYDLRLMFLGFQEQGSPASAADVAALTRLLGRAPRTYADFVRDAVRGWEGGR